MTQLAMTALQKELCRRQLDSIWNLVEDTKKKKDPTQDQIKLVKQRLEKLPALISEYKTCILTQMVQPENATKKADLMAEFDIFNEDANRAETAGNGPPFVIENIQDQSLFLNTAFSANQTSSSSSTYARLPKLNLPPFDGDIASWQSFFDIFTSSIDDNETLAPAQKFQYLRTCLKGSALLLVQNLKLTDANYGVALTILKERYQRNRLISTLHVQGIVKLPSLKDTSYNSVSQFVSTVKEHLSALRALNEPVDQWGKVLTVILTSKLELSIRNRFEAKLNNDELPELDTLLKFLEQFISAQQWQTLEPGKHAHVSTNVTSRERSTPRQPERRHTYHITASTEPNCLACKANHVMYTCNKFKNLTVQQRFDLIKANNHCFNCLASNHPRANCKSKLNCRTCNKRHHSLLHFGESNQSQGSTTTQPTRVDDEPLQVMVATNNSLVNQPRTCSVLLGTALVKIQSKHNLWKDVRVLLDSGSETSLMTESCRRRLNLSWTPTHLRITGITNADVSTVKGRVTCCLRSRHQQRQFSVNALVVTNITKSLPTHKFDRLESAALENLLLADPNYFEPGPIDMLLGADVYFSLIQGIPIHLPEGPFAVETALGVVLSGPIPGPTTTLKSFHISVDEELGVTLRRFWELEEVPSIPVQSEDESKAEHMFDELHSRTTQGRYVVPLLFKTDVVELGSSFGPALACYRSLRTRLSNNPTLRKEYVNFMQDYLESGHMSKLTFSSLSRESGYYIPHHCVVKQDGPAMKLRVVFNASKPTSNGVSLNDNLLPGEPLQIDLAQVVMRQRLYRILLTADIRQMFRQVLISSDQRHYQKILWDFDLSVNPQIFQLNTVTYGTTCAPFLAIRTLHQLAKDEGEAFPLAAYALQRETFVDDIITGSNTVEDALELRKQLIGLLDKAGMELRKWASNDETVLCDLPDDHKLVGTIDLDRDQTMKILGLRWDPTQDAFMYQIHLPDETKSKRQLLSEAARIFDPLGWLSPTTIVAKLLIQELWKHGFGWDEPLPTSVRDRWISFKSQLQSLEHVSIPRWIPTIDINVNLVGFCDASEKAYAAVIYLRSQDADPAKVSLLVAKTRVAPVKHVSLPRLELCAAMLLAQLVSSAAKTLNIKFGRTILWTDSTVTLSWIKSPSYRWKTFVANRVSQISQLTEVSDWYHIRSSENPADCASRGLLPDELVGHSLWWTGPRWLSLPITDWPFTSKPDSSTKEDEANVELKPSTCLVVEVREENEIFQRYSSYSKLLRITAWCLRFIHNCRHREDKMTGIIAVAELHMANQRLIKLVQTEVFGSDMDRLTAQLPVHGTMRKLDPYIDHVGLLRVGGRLHHARRSSQANHPWLLPGKHTLTNLIIRYYHERYLHASPRNVQSMIERTMWIIGARNRIRYVCSKCITCYRNKPTFQSPMMGDLPQQRVTPQKPFSVIGTDYGGPFWVTPYKGRGIKSYKAYLCLFICFATKAVHLELVSDLTTEQFLNAFCRLIARRGRCSHIYSDGGTNFIGAKAHFTELQKFVLSTHYNDHLANKLSEEGIQWHINPPSAPHFGGLWEAAIKSVKSHLSKVVGSQILTFEEMITVLCQIESMLNSRPLTPLSTSPEDCGALTPSHFLTMEPAVSVPVPTLVQEDINHLTRWQLVQRVSQDFWRRWSSEYINTLQLRLKWNKPATQLQVNQLVLIKEPCLPPLQWRLGRVTQVFPGHDGIIRVASVKTAKGTLTRPVVKLAPLPIDPSPEHG